MRLGTNNPYMLAYVYNISIHACIENEKRGTKTKQNKKKARNYLHVPISI